MKKFLSVLLVLLMLFSAMRTDFQYSRVFADLDETASDTSSWDIFNYIALPSMRGIATAVYDNKIYVGGRYDASNQTYVFDGFNWAAGGNLPDLRRNTSFAVFNGDIYCAGGTNGSGGTADTTWKLVDGVWEDQGKTLPNGGITVPGLVPFTVSGTDYLYVVGGYRVTGRNDVYRFDGDSWTDITATDGLPYANQTGQGVVALGGRIYVTALDNGTKVYSYDGTGDAGEKWTAEPSLPSAISGLHTTFDYNGKIYVVGGDNSSGGGYVFSWTPGDASWQTETSIPSPRYRHGRAVLNDHIYIIGGATTSGGDASNQVFRYPGSVLSTTEGTYVGGDTLTLKGYDLKKDMT